LGRRSGLRMGVTMMIPINHSIFRNCLTTENGRTILTEEGIRLCARMGIEVNRVPIMMRLEQLERLVDGIAERMQEAVRLLADAKDRPQQLHLNLAFEARPNFLEEMN